MINKKLFPQITALGRWLLLWVWLLPLGGMAARANPAAPLTPAEPAAAGPRRVNVTQDMYFSQTAIFWFGVDDGPSQMPGRNYADVRVRYTSSNLEIKVIGIDYYLWYDQSNTPGDLTQNDSVAIYVDTAHDRATTPKTDDYYFLLGARDWEDPARYRRQARGNGASWNTSWSATWTNNFYGAWEEGGGYNLNNSHVDYGWDGTFIIPWSVFGLSAPPAEGTLWSLGMQIFDRDSASAMSASEGWPETFSANSPATWGELHFGAPSYTPKPGGAGGTVTIQGSGVMEDAWVGGGPGGLSGHMGNGSNLNHGDDPDLFTGNEQMPVHFPYFNKSYFRFPLTTVPTGKTILSAKLYLYHWGNADPVQATASWVHLFQISDSWAENTITWNNAPLAQENIALTWMDPIRGDGYADPPKEYFWDATQAVAAAYAAGQSANLAIYESDVDQHSNRYLYGSEADEWLASYRPKLVITWGNLTAVVTKRASPTLATNGTSIHYTLTWSGTGQALSLTDVIPAGLGAPTELTANAGAASYNAGTRQVSWSGTPSDGQSVTLTYNAMVQTNGPLMLQNTATLTGGSTPSTSTASVCVDCKTVYLPNISR
jgi:hypothetical protein